MTTPFDFLSSCYTFVIGDRLLPALGSYGIGTVATFMPDAESAQAVLNAHSAELIAQYNRTPSVLLVGNPMQFMRRAAGEGLAGIEAASRELINLRYMFMVRVEEAGSTLPTVLTSIVDDTWSTSLTRTGVQNINHADVLHWQRYDILDPVNGNWGQISPFRDWKSGDPLYELRSEHHVVLLSHVGLLGDWNSPEGSFAFFTSKELALDYHQNHLGNGRNRMFPFAFGAPEDPHKAMANLMPRRIYDLRIRLNQLTKINLDAAWCVNPHSHRENAAYGRLAPFSLGAKIVGNERVFETPKMFAVSGVWKVKANNEFELEERQSKWSGHDTIGWSGGQSIQLIQLDRSFVHETGLESVEIAESLTDTEVEELVSQGIDSARFSDTAALMTRTGQKQVNPLEQFYIACWDSVTGEGADKPWCFPGFYAAVRHLAAYERENDHRARVHGAGSDEHIGFPGSKNPEFEELRSTRFRLGLKRLVTRMIVKNGYRPDDAANLVSLCNGTLRTLHVDFAGFGSDLMWASPTEAQDSLLAALGIDENEWQDWTDNLVLAVDKRGEQLALERMNVSEWQSLDQKSRHFLSTALHHLVEQGSAPQLDYAPISLEVVKALEVEMKAIMENFKATVASTLVHYKSYDKTENFLLEYLYLNKQLTLGNMPHLLARPKSPALQARVALHAFLNTLPNHAFLTDARFLNTYLPRVTNVFRNGGAHDSAIRETTCRECVETLIGSKEHPGLIPQVAAWKSDSTQSTEENS
jgi:hypothetical protein